MQKNATFRPGFLITKINYTYGSVRYRLIFFDCTRPSYTSTRPKRIKPRYPRQNLFEWLPRIAFSTSRSGSREPVKNV